MFRVDSPDIKETIIDIPQTGEISRVRTKRDTVDTEGMFRYNGERNVDRSVFSSGKH